MFPSPRSRLRIKSRETGSAVPSRVSLLILHTQAESGACYQVPLLPPAFRDIDYDGVLYIPASAIGPVPSLRPSNCVPMALTGESPPAQGQ